MNDIEFSNIFYGFLQSLYIVLIILIIYYSSKIGENELESKKIYIISPNSTCNLASSLQQITLNNNLFKYKMLNFVTTTDITEAGNYSTICNSSCSNNQRNIVTSCNKDDQIYQSCINLLQPPSGCTNNSNPVGIFDNKTIYVKSLVTSNT